MFHDLIFCIIIFLILIWLTKFFFFICSAQRLLDGDEHEQINKLFDYRLELLRAHPTSTVMFKCIEGKFEGMCVCLAPLSEGFLTGCRRIVSLDGFFLKGLFGG